MRAVVLADVHANLISLDAVLADARSHGEFDELWILGDIVGYGPRPNECVSRLKEFRHRALAGNHDRAATGVITTKEFNPHAAAAAAWTADNLLPETVDYLAALPDTVQAEDFTLVHGSLRDPIWEYVFTVEVAAAHLELQTTTYSMVGHTHIPTVVEEQKADLPTLRRLSAGERVRLKAARLILNPGSSGQSRDGDPRASYAILDLQARTFTHHRVEYDVGKTQQQMREADLPRYLIDRLALGR